MKPFEAFGWHYDVFSLLFCQELRDENDELRLQCEALTQQVNSSVKRRPSHRKKQDSQKVHRHGSLLSDYTNPVVIKRNKEGVTSSDESDTADQQDGTRVPSVRISGDGGSNEDAGKLQNRCARRFFSITGAVFFAWKGEKSDISEYYRGINE